MKQIRSWLIPIKEFYICGINVFENTKSIETIDFSYEIEPEEISDVDNSGVEYSDVKNAKLSHYIIDNYNFYIAISSVESFYLITLFIQDGFQIPLLDEETDIQIEKYMFAKLITDEQNGVIYSQDKRHRVIIEKRDDGLFLYTFEKIFINGWAMIDFPRYESEIYKDFFYFDYVREGLFASMEDAIREAKLELKNFD